MDEVTLAAALVGGAVTLLGFAVGFWRGRRYPLGMRRCLSCVNGWKRAD